MCGEGGRRRVPVRRGRGGRMWRQRAFSTEGFGEKTEEVVEKRRIHTFLRSILFSVCNDPNNKRNHDAPKDPETLNPMKHQILHGGHTIQQCQIPNHQHDQDQRRT